MKNAKVGLAMLTVAGGVVILAVKMAAYFASGSIALLSDALESIVNIVASGMMLYAVRLADTPADRDHQYGHQKVEAISSLIEGVLIAVAVVMIVKTALPRLWHPAELESLNLALGLSLGATLLNGGLSWALSRSAKKHGSLALEGDALHLLSDVVSSLAVVLGLFLARSTGWWWLDPALALAVSVLLAKMAFGLITKSAGTLMDRACPEVEERIRELLVQHQNLFLDAHELKTRQSGNQVFAEIHLTVKGDQTVAEAHAITDHLEEDLKAEIPGVSLTIHIENPGHH